MFDLSWRLNAGGDEKFRLPRNQVGDVVKISQFAPQFRKLGEQRELGWRGGGACAATQQRCYRGKPDEIAASASPLNSRVATFLIDT